MFFFKKKPFDIDAIYVDQAMVNTHNRGFNFFSSYTPYGIKMIDTEYANRIKYTQEDPKVLKKEILQNPHLHKEIKKNLIQNMNSYVKRKIRGTCTIEKHYTYF
jgi:hypothetical protein